MRRRRSALLQRMGLAALFVVHLMIVLCGLAVGGLYYVSCFYGPTLELELPDKYFPDCQVSAHSLDELTIDESTPLEEALAIGHTHGSAIVKNVINKTTAQNFRDYVLRANHELRRVRILEGTHRHHIQPPHWEPTVQELFQEFANSQHLRALIDGILGPGAALVSFSVISAEYGAVDQEWHNDASEGAKCFPDLFVPEYSFVVALQDTTYDMGATGVCPGAWAWCWDHDLDCPLRAELKQGDVFMYSSELLHKGSGHSDPTAPMRCQAFLTFAGALQGPHDKRALPFGTERLIDWRAMGHNLDDMSTIQDRPWRPWHAFGLFNGKKGVQPYYFQDYIFHLYRNPSQIAPSLEDDFNSDTFDAIVNDLVWYYGIFVMAYMSFFLPLAVWWTTTRSGDGKQRDTDKTKRD